MASMTDVARHRAALFDAYRQALRAADPEEATSRALKHADPPAPVTLCALGKAAASMARAAHRVLGDAIVEAAVVSAHPKALPEGAAR